MRQRFTKLLLTACVILTYLSISVNNAAAQELITVKGKVVDESKNPLPGAVIKVNGGTASTAADVNGNFTLNKLDQNATLEVTFVGYKPLDIAAKDASTTIVMKSTAANLEEVVVVGYGTQKAKDVTGSIKHIDATAQQNQHPSSLFDVLRANAAGLNIGQDPSAAGGSPSIQIRGNNSLTAVSNPLIILDGAIYSGTISSINPEDIQSVDILKDGSAAAIYGASSAGGVIAVTTKKGKSEKPLVSLNSTVGQASIESPQQYYSGQGFIDWRVNVENALHATNLTTKPSMYNNPNSLPSGISTAQWLGYDASSGDPTQVWLRRLNFQPIEITNYLAGNETDWYKLSFQKGLRQDHTISVSGKGNNVNYYLSGNYQKNDGVIKGDQFNIYRMRINLDAKITKFLTIGTNTVFSVKDQGGFPLDWSTNVAETPFASLYTADGSDYSYQPVGNSNTATNPLGIQKYNDVYDKTYSLNSSLYGEVTLPFNIKFKTTFTPNFSFNNRFVHQESAWPGYASQGGLASRTQSTTYQWQLDNILSWDHTYNEVHHFTVLAGQNANKFQYWYTSVSNSLFSPNDNLGYHELNLGTAPVIASSPSGGSDGNDYYNTATAYFGRLSYSYDDKYLVNATIRRDGNSAFGENYKYGTFPSIGLGWNFSKEKFINLKWLDYGKLRATYSTNGNSNISRYATLNKITAGSILNVTPAGAVITTSQLYISQFGSDNLKWENTASSNIGLDFSVFKGILSGSLEAYYAKTTDLLARRAVPLNEGISNGVYANLGQVDNRGFEISLNSKNIERKNFIWTSSFNFSLNRNKIVHLYGNYDANGVEQDDINNSWFIGHDINSVWDYKVLGVYQTADAAQAAKYNKQPGDFNLEDVNGDGKYTNADKQFLGTTTPKFRWTLSNNFQIGKSFDFSFLIYSNWGQLSQFDMAKNSSVYIERYNFQVRPYWTADNAINDFARIQSNDAGTSYHIWKPSSFIRLDNVALGYTVPKDFLKKFSVQSAKLFVTVRNPYVWASNNIWTKYAWDPETINNSDGSTTPTPRLITLGLNVSL